MDAQRIAQLANDPSTPRFMFGGDALKDWTRKHRNSATGRCALVGGSGWYLVKHTSLNPQQRPDFWTLNQWHYDQVTPQSVDVPHGVVNPGVAPTLVDGDRESGARGQTFGAGQPVEVLTYGLCPRWNRATFHSHQPATATTRELYYFSSAAGCYVVNAEELPDRVRAVA